MTSIELVFRTVGERTSDIALELALKHIAPDKVHIIDHVRPFSQAVQQMLTLPFEHEFIVFMDADCLILEDMRPFLQRNIRPYVDCYVLDKFRGRIHCGIHISRRDVVQAMQRVHMENMDDDLKYILRPESRIRNIALGNFLGEHSKAFRTFRIFHDFFQYHRDIFAKYGLRELRSRSGEDTNSRLDFSIQQWDESDLDFAVARLAVDYTRDTVGPDSTTSDIAAYIAALPEIAGRELERMGIAEKSPLTMDEVMELNQSTNIDRHFQRKQTKVFGIGLSRTGTKTLTKALNLLGYDVVHYPIDEVLFHELTGGTYTLSLLNDFDGITDITAAPFYAQFADAYPDSKFILTVRDKKSWLASLERHWHGKNIFEDVPGMETTLKLRRFLRAATYGCYTFNRERMSYVYDLHHKNVTDYFKDRPGSLLIFDIAAGEGWEKLCTFLNEPEMEMPFPWVKSASML